MHPEAGLAGFRPWPKRWAAGASWPSCQEIFPWGRSTACKLIVGFLDLFSRISGVSWFLLSVTRHLCQMGQYGDLSLIRQPQAPKLISWMFNICWGKEENKHMYLDPKVTYLRNILDLGNTNKARIFTFLSFFNLALGDGGLGWSIFVLLFCFLKPSLSPRTRTCVVSWA